MGAYSPQALAFEASLHGFVFGSDFVHWLRPAGGQNSQALIFAFAWGNSSHLRDALRAVGATSIKIPLGKQDFQSMKISSCQTIKQTTNPSLQQNYLRQSIRYCCPSRLTKTICNRWPRSATTRNALTKERDGNKQWTHWGLNPGPSACEADVIPLHHVPS